MVAALVAVFVFVFALDIVEVFVFVVEMEGLLLLPLNVILIVVAELLEAVIGILVADELGVSSDMTIFGIKSRKKKI